MVYNLRNTKSGDSFSGVTFNITVNGVVSDLTAATIILTVTRQESVKLSLSTSDSIELSIPASGQFKILPFVVTLIPWVYKYSIQITYPTGIKKTYIEGTWVIYS